MEKKLAEEQPDHERQARETKFLRNKAKEYKTQAKKLEVCTSLIDQL